MLRGGYGCGFVRRLEGALVGFWRERENIPGLPIVMAPRTMGNLVFAGEDMVDVVMRWLWMRFEMSL